MLPSAIFMRCERVIVVHSLELARPGARQDTLLQ
jgi:hypothetical protein